MNYTRRQPTAYWWRGKTNFGDLLTPLLLDRFSDIKVEWAGVNQADMVVVGSVLEHLPQGYDGIIAGSGKLREEEPVDVSSAHVLGVRGPLTAKLAKGMPSDYVIGDPGLLANELVEVEKEYSLGIVPHWSDTQLEQRKEFLKYDPLIIKPDEHPLDVIRNIGRCRKIISSSLHGIILADAFGIPRRTETCPRFVHEGGDFKFRDHNEAVGVEFKLGETQEAPRYLVEARQHELFDMLDDLGRIVTGR